MKATHRTIGIGLAVAMLLLTVVGTGAVVAHDSPTYPGHACHDEGNTNSDNTVRENNPHCGGDDPVNDRERRKHREDRIIIG